MSTVKAELIFNSQGVSSTTIEANGYIEWIQFLKQIEGVGQPVVRITHPNLILPIFEGVLEESKLCFLRYSPSDLKGDLWVEAGVTPTRMLVEGELVIRATGGSPSTRLEVLICLSKS